MIVDYCNDASDQFKCAEGTECNETYDGCIEISGYCNPSNPSFSCGEGYECNESTYRCDAIEGYCNDAIEEFKCTDWLKCNEEHKCGTWTCKNHTDCGDDGECINNTCMQKIIKGNCVDNGCADENYECISNKCVYKHTNGLVFDVKTTSNNQTIEFKELYFANSTEKVVVDCGTDGQVVNLVKCKYARSGDHTMTVLGRLRGFQLTTSSKRNSGFINLKQWGKDNHYTTCNYMFAYAEDFTTISDPIAPDLRQVTNMRSMFYNASSFNQPLNDWDVSNVYSMEEMFYLAKAFNTPIIGWKLNREVRTAYMFDYCPLKCSDFRPASTPKVVNNANFGCVE